MRYISAAPQRSQIIFSGFDEGASTLMGVMGRAGRFGGEVESGMPEHCILRRICRMT
jgi:hypothetical protein